jgi:hypothetical protein
MVGIPSSKYYNQQAPIGGSMGEYADELMEYQMSRGTHFVSRSQPSKRYNQRTNESEVNKMRKITVLPKYGIGEVVDISFKNGGLPNRVLILGIHMNSEDNGWMYDVKSEAFDDNIVMAETVMKKFEANQWSKVGKMQVIIDRYLDGWRYCGNYSEETAKANGQMLSENNNIKNIKLFPAVDTNGLPVSGEYGLWIRYHNTIGGDGSMISIAKEIDIK